MSTIYGCPCLLSTVLLARAEPGGGDFVLRRGKRLAAIEIKSVRQKTALPGMEVFSKTFRPARMWLVGGQGISLEEFLASPVSRWID